MTWWQILLIVMGGTLVLGVVLLVVGLNAFLAVMVRNHADMGMYPEEVPPDPVP